MPNELPEGSLCRPQATARIARRQGRERTQTERVLRRQDLPDGHGGQARLPVPPRPDQEQDQTRQQDFSIQRVSQHCPRGPPGT